MTPHSTLTGNLVISTQSTIKGSLVITPQPTPTGSLAITPQSTPTGSLVITTQSTLKGNTVITPQSIRAHLTKIASSCPPRLSINAEKKYLYIYTYVNFVGVIFIHFA